MPEQTCPICDTAHDDQDEPFTQSCCWSCYKVEPVPDDVYRVCFECAHVYATPEELEAAWEREVEGFERIEAPDGFSTPIPKHKDAKDIFFCQECLHDF